MKKVCFIINFFYANLIMLSIRSKITRFLTSTFIFIIVSLFCFPYVENKNQFCLSIFIYIIIFGLLFSISYKRLSNNCIYNIFTKRISMNILNTKRYKEINYLKQKEQIKDILIMEFVEAFNNIKNEKKVSFTTHPWLIKYVVFNEQLNNLYDKKVIQTNKFKKIDKEILCLIGFRELLEFDNSLLDQIERKRQVVHSLFIKRH